MDQAGTWISLIGGLVLIGLGIALPRLRLRRIGRDWDAVFTSERLRKIARAQERAGQVTLVAFGAGFATSSLGALLQLPDAVTWTLSLSSYAVGIIGAIAQLMIIVRSRRIE
jgi:hypothetical protein